jgi:hypothetical protein
VVSGLFVYSVGRKQWKYVVSRSQYVHHFFGKRILAWRQLDIHRVGIDQCIVFPTFIVAETKPQKRG